MNRLFTLLLVAVAFTACKKEDKTITPTPVDKPISYLNRVTYFNSQLGQELLQDTIALDAQGNLAMAWHRDTTGNYIPGTNIRVLSDPILLNHFEKDNHGNIVKADGVYDIYDYTDLYITISYQLEYNANGNVSRRTFVRSDKTVEVTTYAYDNYNRLLKETHNNLYDNSKSLVREYTYSNPGTLNPASMKEMMNDDATTTTEYLYTYDSNPTPYSTLPKILYYMGIGPLSVNNVVNVSVRDENNTTTNIYRYNGEGLPFVKQSNKDTEYKYYYGTL